MSDQVRDEPLTLSLTAHERDTLIQLADSLGVTPEDLFLNALYECYFDWLGDPPTWPTNVERAREVIAYARDALLGDQL